MQLALPVGCFRSILRRMAMHDAAGGEQFSTQALLNLHRLCAEIRFTIKPFVESSHVLRRMALNAEVAVARHGGELSGPITVLAAELVTLSQSIGDSMEELATAADTLSRCANEGVVQARLLDKYVLAEQRISPPRVGAAIVSDCRRRSERRVEGLLAEGFSRMQAVFRQLKGLERMNTFLSIVGTQVKVAVAEAGTSGDSLADMGRALQAMSETRGAAMEKLLHSLANSLRSLQPA